MCVALTKKTGDHSCMDHFQFSFLCDRCGKLWDSGAKLFTAGAYSEIDRREVRDMLWTHEHRVAFERANLEAQFHFNHCPICDQWVCDTCFAPLGSDEYDLCLDCAENARTNKTTRNHSTN